MNRESISWLIINHLSLDRPTVFRSRWCAVIREPGSDLETPAREYIHCDGFMWRPSQKFVDSIFNVRHKTKWGRFDGNTMTWAKHGDLGIGMWRKQQVGKEAYNYVQACPWSRASDTGQASWILHVLFISCVLMLYAALRGLVLCFFKISKWLLKIKPSKRSKTETMRLKDAKIILEKDPPPTNNRDKQYKYLYLSCQQFASILVPLVATLHSRISLPMAVVCLGNSSSKWFLVLAAIGKPVSDPIGHTPPRYGLRRYGLFRSVFLQRGSCSSRFLSREHCK